MKMDARKQQVLLAIITDYIATAEPVGSRTISRKYKLGVSPATIRNEMSDLEELGFIEQPHTSAGRIPSQLGYRYYVDFLMKKQELSLEEENVIKGGYLNKVKDVGQVVQRTGNLLSKLTNCAAVITTPRMGDSSFKHIHLVQMNPGQAMLVVVMDTGSVQHQIIDISESLDQDDLDTISKVMNAKLQGLTMDSIKITLIKEIYLELSKQKQILDLALQLVQDSLNLETEDKIYLGGVFNILNQPEFHSVEKVKTLLSLLEQEQLLSNLLGHTLRSDGVTVRIGEEIRCQEITDCSMVTAPYRMRGQPTGYIGVLGPTRMDYAKVVSVVECMTRNLSDALERMFKGGGK